MKVIKKRTAVAVFVFILPAIVLGQTNTTEPAKNTFKTRRILYIAAVPIGIAGLSLFDLKGQEYAKQLSAPAIDKVSKYAFEPLGEGKYVLAGLTVLSAYGLLFKKPYEVNVAITTAKSVLISSLITQIFKYSVRRYRPFQADEYSMYTGKKTSQYHVNGPFPFLPLGEYNSFSSGHAAFAFSVATTVSMAYKEYKAVPYIAYALATLAALSRVYDNKHWLSDIAAGAVIGWTTGKLVCNKNISLSPQYYRDKPQLCILWTF